jgi:hypothetical protein
LAPLRETLRCNVIRFIIAIEQLMTELTFSNLFLEVQALRKNEILSILSSIATHLPARINPRPISNTENLPPPQGDGE